MYLIYIKFSINLFRLVNNRFEFFVIGQKYAILSSIVFFRNYTIEFFRIEFYRICRIPFLVILKFSETTFGNFLNKNYEK